MFFYLIWILSQRFAATSWRLPGTHLLVLLLLVAVILVAQGERQKGEVYSLISSLICRIDRVCESYSPPTIHFFVVAPNTIIVPPHSTLHSSTSSTPYPRWLMAFPFSHFSFPFFLIFSHPSYHFQWNMNLVHLFCLSLSLGCSFNQFKYVATNSTKIVR